MLKTFIQTWPATEIKEFLASKQAETEESNSKTFLEIVNREHYEIYWSRIYAFFFDPKGDHGFEDLFLRSLQELIWKDSKPEWIFDKDTTSVRTEVTTIKGNRIDLLIMDKQHCIIIENKVFHHIHGNDFKDYWGHVKLHEANKRGVLLSLKKRKQELDNFINITHQELITQVKNNFNSENIESKYKIFLDDWETNIKKMTSKTMNEEEAKFLLEHQEELLKAKDFYEKAKNYLLKEAEIAIQNFEGLKLRAGIHKKDYRIGRSEKVNCVEFVVDFRDFDKSQKMYLILKIDNVSTINETHEYRSWLEDNGENVKSSKLWIQNPNDNQKNYCHLAFKEYLLNDSRIENLSGFIIEEFEKFEPLFLEIEKLLKTEKGVALQATKLVTI